MLITTVTSGHDCGFVRFTAMNIRNHSYCTIEPKSADTFLSGHIIATSTLKTAIVIIVNIYILNHTKFKILLPPLTNSTTTTTTTTTINIPTKYHRYHYCYCNKNVTTTVHHHLYTIIMPVLPEAICTNSWFKNTAKHSQGINGGLTEWMGPGECTRSCGGGVRFNTRTCTSPKPSLNGADCDGATAQLATPREWCNSITYDVSLKEISSLFKSLARL